MKPEPLIQKLFAIERAIGRVPAATLRAMIIDAEESALRLELDNLHSTDAVQWRLEQRRAGGPGAPRDDSGLPRIA